MTIDDAFDIFDELPQRVQIAVVSLLVGLRISWRVQYHEYPRHVAEYIQASGLIDVRMTDLTTSFRSNDLTRHLQTRRRELLEHYGIEFTKVL